MSEKSDKLFNKNFFLLWQGQLVSQIGTQISSIALMFWIKHTTGSATLMGLIMTVAMIPAVIIGPISGAIVDNYSRRNIIVISDLINGLNMIFLSFVLSYSFFDTNGTIVIIFIISLIMGILMSLFSPAAMAAIPDIVSENKLAHANSMAQSTVQLSTFLGQAIGGYLFVLLSAPLLILIDGISYLFSSVSETFIKIPQTITKRDSFKEKINQIRIDTIDGIKYVWRNKGLRFIFISFAILTFFITPIIMLLPFFVEDILKLQADWYGYLLASFGFGSLLGYGINAIINPQKKMRYYTVIASLLIFSLCYPLLGIFTNKFIVLLILLIIGISDGYFSVNVITLLQVSTSSEMRGRLFALLNSVALVLSPIAMSLSGITADLLDKNIPLIYLFCGIFILITSCLVMVSKHYREFLEQ